MTKIPTGRLAQLNRKLKTKRGQTIREDDNQTGDAGKRIDATLKQSAFKKEVE